MHNCQKILTVSILQKVILIFALLPTLSIYFVTKKIQIHTFIIVSLLYLHHIKHSNHVHYIQIHAKRIMRDCKRHKIILLKEQYVTNQDNKLNI